MIFWNGVLSPICGHYFWDNQYGATKFCQKLGYDSGQQQRSGNSYATDAFQVGRCNENDDWLSCNGGGNHYSAEEGWCAAGNNVGLIVTCQGTSGKTASCTGNE